MPLPAAQPCSSRLCSLANDDCDSSKELPVHFVAQADQIQAMQADFGDEALQIVVVALAHPALEGDNGSEDPLTSSHPRSGGPRSFASLRSCVARLDGPESQ